MNSLIKLLVLSPFLFAVANCNGIKNSQYYEYLSTTTETLPCLNNYTHPSSVKITGTASFFKRGINLVTQTNLTTQLPELKNLTLGDPLIAAIPIRYAEIAVYNSKNQIVQCGRTNALGLLKGTDNLSDLLIPATPDTYSVHVMSRSNIQLSFAGKPNFGLNVSVKQDKYTNKLYTLEKSAASNGIDDVILNLTAYARQTESAEISGGAFNILNNIYTTYSYINSNTGLRDTTCLNKKINVFWKAGFNAFQYYYSQSDPSTLSSNSFYNLDGDKNLYITGGRLGNTSIENTDHFDDYVIIHELGHFIEDQCGQLLTPGGSHVIISRIDPQLAWTEGWANYLAAQVLYNNINMINPEFEGKMFTAGFTAAATDKKWSFLSSTFGFSDSQLNVGNGSGVMFDLKKAGTNPDIWQDGLYEGFATDKVDPTRYLGEGHFREGAITRGLFKLTNACGTTCATAPLSFEKIWQSFDSLTGAGQNNIKFKSSHTVLENLKSLAGGAWVGDTKTKAESEALHLKSDGVFITAGFYKWIPYGTALTTLQGASCSPGMHIEPRIDDPVLAGSNSDHRYSNHYYLFDPALLPSVNTISVKFTKQAGTDTEFDLILFQENYIFNSDYFCASVASDGTCLTSYVPSRSTTSDILRSDRSSGLVSFKKITNLQALDPTKKYLLNIRAYTPSKSISSTTTYSYEIRDSLTDGIGNYLCF